MASRLPGADPQAERYALRREISDYIDVDRRKHLRKQPQDATNPGEELIALYARRKALTSLKSQVPYLGFQLKPYQAVQIARAFKREKFSPTFGVNPADTTVDIAKLVTGFKGFEKYEIGDPHRWNVAILHTEEDNRFDAPYEHRGQLCQSEVTAVISAFLEYGHRVLHLSSTADRAYAKAEAWWYSGGARTKKNPPIDDSDLDLPDDLLDE